MNEIESAEFAKKLSQDYGMKMPQDVIASVYSQRPKLRVLLSRSSFRADAVRTDRNVSIQRQRRSFLRNLLSLAAVSVPILLWLKVAFFTPQAQLPSYVLNPGSQTGGSLLANASSIPSDQSIAINDPTLGPILLIHLDNGQFVAYSSICTHAGCQVQFDPSAKEITCPCHGAVYNPYNNAQVIAGPAPSPLQRIQLRYDQSTGNIYLA
jgi:nitrite reductase/ring-hydroxylating ferredoxin subunit